MEKSSLYKLAAIFMAIVAIILSFVLSGAVVYDVSETIIGEYEKTISESVKLSTLTFGFWTSKLDGGISYFAFLSFFIVFAGVLLVLADLCVENKKLGLVGSALLIFGGLLILLVLNNGTDLHKEVESIFNTANRYSVSFKDYYEEYSLGIGTYAWLILCVIGGICGFLGANEE